ncbi:hypothetical protein AMTR_s00053p00054600 [Amborella trichopoda]|uniref:SWIM-type domain-containing protein n=1 Tax=Amborella trichopoda TaxID=13333 RepID=W1P553_AMBTC|nr:hypothetical protein AMTR_s00053p00054600 [Amborella trichopoda]
MKVRFLHTVISAIDTQLEIHYLGKKYDVDLTHWRCSCRKWQLSGILCTHTIAAINHMHLDSTAYCLKYFTVETFKRAFQTPFGPIPYDIELTDIFNRTVLPPRTTRVPGRSKKQRKRSEIEQPITRPMKWKRYDAVGHNKRTYREPME